MTRSAAAPEKADQKTSEGKSNESGWTKTKDGWTKKDFDLFDQAMELIPADIRGRLSIKVSDIKREEAAGTTPSQFAIKVMKKQLGHIAPKKAMMRWQRIGRIMKTKGFGSRRNVKGKPTK